jgi:hypothetical protein
MWERILHRADPRAKKTPTSVKGAPLIRAILAAAIVASGCQPASENPSALRHDAGATRREPTAPLRDCRAERFSVGSVSAAADSYLQKIARALMEGNPATFAGPFGPTAFCFTTTADETINAFAYSNSGDVLFNVGLLRVATSDAQVAGIMAHELAHVTMQHTADLVHPRLKTDATWVAANAELQAMIERDSERLEQLWEDYTAARLSQQDLRRRAQAIFSPELRAQREDLRAKAQQWQDDLFAGPVVEDAGWDLYETFQTKFQPILDGAAGQEGPGGMPADDGGAQLTDLRARLDLLTAALDALYAAEDAALSADDRDAIEASDQRVQDVMASIAAIESAEQAQRARLREIVTQVIGAEAEANWREREADEVGFELYLRAGFDPARFSWFTEKLLGDQLDACLTRIHAAASLSEGAIERGTGTHPSNCWRLYDIQFLEAELHREVYGPLLPAATKVTILEGELEAVKAGLPAPVSADP